MKKNIFLVVAGLAIGAIAAAGYEIYKAAKGIKEVTDSSDDFSVYIDFEDED